jgi:hypothetical protein
MSDSELDRADWQDISDVLIRYATGIDTRDWDLFRTCFTADCHADYGDIGVWEGVEAITEFMVTAHAGMGHTMHRVTNHAIRASGSAAVARSYIDAVLMAEDGESGLEALGFYDDEFARTDDGWKIARRTYTPVRFELLGGS